MKKTTTILTTLTVLLFSCSNRNNRVTVKDTYGNGQPKTTIYKTIDNKNTYYEIGYDSLGRIQEITPYIDGKKNGTQVYFRHDNLGVAGLLPFKDNKREGFTYEFYSGQQTAFKGKSKDDEFNGVSTWYYEDGTPEKTGIRTNSKAEGEWIEYYDNGQLKAKGTFLNGNKNNDWKYWNNDGTIDTTTQD
ncbi:MAG: hypothetical protein HYZ42_15205 [Bacteroidetes bacterium]|nr:hypothetical protein [Bacteroidota bacterium]